MKFPIQNYIILFTVLIVLGYLYRRFEDKRIREEDKENYDTIRKYLLNDSSDSLEKNKKTIMWIHIAYEYNARNWLSFGSRSSLELNQPYMYLTVKSIIQQCDESFHICLIDDSSFKKLIPGWSIDMTTISTPVLEKMRALALTKLLYMYGGIIVPPSFLCMRNLHGIYEKGTSNGKMFICENINRTITHTSFPFYPDTSFMGSEKENPVVKDLIDFIQRTISSDYTAQSEFLGEFDRWCEKRVKQNRIRLIDGRDIGVKDMQDNPIPLEKLLSQHYIDIYPKAYGIYVPADEILKRRKYEWFARLSPKQVLEADTILSKYMILANSPDSDGGVIESLTTKPDWVGFWKVPSDAPVWGLKPNFLGDNLNRLEYS